MFDELFSLTSQQMENFSDTIRDQFGHSIISEVFEPILKEISALQQMENDANERITEIDQLTADLQILGG